MKIVYKNLIDSETGKNVVAYMNGDFDRKKFKKQQNKIARDARAFARRLKRAFVD